MRSEEFNPLRIRLAEDVTYFSKRLEDETDKYIIRRSYVRSVFAFIEGYLYGFKQISLRLSEEPVGIKLSAEEIIALKEVEISIDGKGNIRERPKFIPAMNNMAFSMAAIAKQHEANFTLNKGGQGWEAYQMALKIRDRLMHPKNYRELQLTDTELEMVQTAHSWFKNELRGLEIAIEDAARRSGCYVIQGENSEA